MRALLTAASIVTIGAGSASDAPAPTVISLQQKTGNQVAIEGRVGAEAGLFLFDSGWGLSAVTPEMGKRVGCKPWGQITGFRAIGERTDSQQCQPITVTLSGRELALPSVTLVDIDRLMPAGSPRYAGAIGLDAFAGKTITIRSRARQIVIEDAASLAARVRRAKPIPIRLMRGEAGASLTAYVGVPTASGTLWMLLDTGNGGGTMIGRHAASLLGLDADPAKAHGQVLTMRVVDGVVFQGPVQVLNLIMDGNIGSDFLDRWDLTLDLAQSKGWLAQADIYPRGRQHTSISIDDRHLVVN